MIVVRGAGDLASGTIYELHKAGYRVLALECKEPAAIRRKVCFSEAVYEGHMEVEGVTARKIASVQEVQSVWDRGEVPVLVDEGGDAIRKLKPLAVIDLILAKRNLGTKRDMAPLAIGAGPGFTAGEDVDVVIETMRGYQPGKAIYEGSALPNTGIPGMVGGFAKERVIHSPAEGMIKHVHQIGDVVEKGEVIGYVKETPITASLTGILRGWIREGFYVKKGMKIADIEPRLDKKEACYKRSDKAIAIAKGILKVVEDRIRLRHLLQISESDRVIAAVGGGGKTTLLYELAEEFAASGKRVIVTTTTHMIPMETKSDRIRTVGIPCEHGKIKELADSEYMNLKQQCDILLIEADGAKRKPFKVPAGHEPVIPDDVQMVIGIAGASAIGRPIKEVCHREGLVCEFLGKTLEDRISKEDIAAALKSEKGQKKNVTQTYRMVAGQADLLSKEQKVYFEKEGIRLYTRKEEKHAVIS